VARQGTLAAVALLLTIHVSAPIAWAEDLRIVDVQVNGRIAGEAVVSVEPGGYAISQQSWAALSLPEVPCQHLERTGGTFLLVEAGHGVSAAFDEQAQMLRLTIPADVMPRRTIDLTGGYPRGTIASTPPSTFLNYAVQHDSIGSSRIAGELGVGIRGAMLLSGGSWSDGSFVRAPSRLVVDDRSALVRWTGGELVASNGALGSTVAIAGLSVGREFSIDPYFNRFQGGIMRGATDTPGTIEVYSNDRLVRRENIPAGTFDLRGIQRQFGAGTTRVVVRDAFGQERTWTDAYYEGDAALPRGVHEFSDAIGWQREESAAGNTTYGPLTMLSRHRWGMTDRVTLGWTAEARPDLATGGPGAAVQTPIGQLQMNGAIAARHGGAGAAAAFGYSYLRSLLSVSARWQMRTIGYAVASAVQTEELPTEDWLAMVGVPLGARGHLVVQHARTAGGHAPSTTRTSLMATQSLRGRTTLSLIGARAVTDREVGYEATVGVSVLFGRRSSASVSGTYAAGRSTVEAALQRSMPTQTGAGYNLRISPDRQQLLGRAEYQNSVGRFAIDAEQGPSGTRTVVSAAGAIVAVGRTVGVTRPVRDAFAVVDLDGLSGVPVLLGNLPVGSTGRSGRVFLPDLISYYANDVSIDDTRIPLDWDVSADRMHVAPPYRGGALLRFPVTHVQLVSGDVEGACQATARVPVLVAADTGTTACTSEERRR
jgi:outer membrane usher protein